MGSQRVRHDWAPFTFIFTFSRASSRPRHQTRVSSIGKWVLYRWATREARIFKRRKKTETTLCNGHRRLKERFPLQKFGAENFAFLRHCHYLDVCSGTHWTKELSKVTVLCSRLACVAETIESNSNTRLYLNCLQSKGKGWWKMRWKEGILIPTFLGTWYVSCVKNSRFKHENIGFQSNMF